MHRFLEDVKISQKCINEIMNEGDWVLKSKGIKGKYVEIWLIMKEMDRFVCVIDEMQKHINVNIFYYGLLIKWFVYCHLCQILLKKNNNIHKISIDFLLFIFLFYL